jgi:hypothetical protein
MYYIEIVPTDIETFVSHVKTYQYSVKENTRTIGMVILIDEGVNISSNSPLFRPRPWISRYARYLH